MGWLVKLGKTLLFISVVFIGLAIWNKYKSPKFLSLSERYKAKIVWQPLGFDSIRCVKLKVTRKRYNSVIQELNLLPAIEYPKFYGKFPSNCKNIDWWNVDFPSNAHHFWLPEDGMDTRIHTAHINGYLYYTFEIN